MTRLGRQCIRGRSIVVVAGNNIGSSRLLKMTLSSGKSISTILGGAVTIITDFVEPAPTSSAATPTQSTHFYHLHRTTSAQRSLLSCPCCYHQQQHHHQQQQRPLSLHHRGSRTNLPVVFALHDVSSIATVKRYSNIALTTLLYSSLY